MTRPDLLTVPEVADILGLHPRTIQSWCRSQRIRAILLPNGSYRIRRTDLDAMLQVEPA